MPRDRLSNTQNPGERILQTRATTRDGPFAAAMQRHMLRTVPAMAGGVVCFRPDWAGQVCRCGQQHSTAINGKKQVKNWLFQP